MKFSIRTKFTLGMVFMFIIILILLGFSAWSLLRLSKKTNAILSENQVSVVHARNMTENLMNLNQEISNSFVTNRAVDTSLIKNEFNEFDKSIHLELNNITEAGEDKLATSLKYGINEYNEMFKQFIKSPKQVELILLLQKKFGMLYQQLAILSQMNEKAIEVKTDDAKDSVKAALTQLSVIGTFCFLISFSFIFSFASYFNERFSQLYNGIKEIVASNYGQRLYFDGTDEFFEISLLFNQMAEKLDDNRSKLSVPLLSDSESEEIIDDIQELKNMLIRMKSIESQAKEVISKFENRS
ncbi:MAG TPA: MCP four helix bundle domain-containing protein [Prolixibacteraceae bacterium]|nr:MCP four helix bundle domain-containing protein [Prolixibacteraceae bacterium]